MDEDVLQELDIRDWKEISDNFEHADLLLGNGFSLNFFEVFDYESLFEEFLKGCELKDADLFRSFGNTNFESIQDQLLNTKRVNELLDLPSDPIEPAIEKLRNGLINAVQNNHPSSEAIDFNEINEISKTLDHFEDVFTLNYDLFLYHIVMSSNDRHRNDTKVRPYQDYFWSTYTKDLLEFKDYQNYTKYKHAYYLHGALFLLPGHRIDYHNDLKLKRNKIQSGSQLIYEVADMVRNGRLPLFVSEGRPEDKIRTITHSPYLNFAYRKLKEASKWLVIYGWSASSEDHHIIEALTESSQEKRNIAMSIYLGDKSPDEVEAELHRVKSKLVGQEIVFFDSSTLFNN